jgi:coenzyme PQQ precursor peptide PqqA
MISNSRILSDRADNTFTPARHVVGSVNQYKEINMWTKPAATEMRFGFEVTMYVMNK